MRVLAHQSVSELCIGQMGEQAATNLPLDKMESRLYTTNVN
jgi:hypothetical protein